MAPYPASKRAAETLGFTYHHLYSTPMMDADIAYACADISKARRLLGYDPQVSVEEGVRRFWQWYQQVVLE